VSLSHYWPAGHAGIEGEFSWQKHVDELAEFIAAMDLGPVYLVGHSRGGCVAFQLARTYPALVKTLTLADPGGPLQIDGIPEAALPKQFRDPLPAYTRAAAGEVKCRTLLVAGEKSPRMYRDNVEKLAGWMAHVDKRFIAGASHGMNVTHPAAFNRLLQAFVNGAVWSVQPRMGRQPAAQLVVVGALQFAEDVGAVGFHRARAAGRHEDAGDFLVRLAQSHQASHLALARRQFRPQP
jgi:pimeloyl-ACP methyl ester carboxylesterase